MLRPIDPFARTRLGVHARLLAVVLTTLGGGACLRFGYGDLVDPSDGKRDAGTRDAGPISHAGEGGSAGEGRSDGGAGTAGESGTPADSGTHEAGAGGNGDDAGNEPDAAVIEPPGDAATDAGVIEPPSDAGDADGGTIAIWPKCPERPGVLFCDGFEDPDMSRWAYPVFHNGTVTLASMPVRTGTASLLAKTEVAAPGTEARWATDVLAHQKSGDAWLRFYDWVPSTFTVTRHFSVGVMSEIEMPYMGFELRILPSLVDINATNGVFPSTLSFPRDQWVCVELHVFIDPNVGVYEAYLDGVLAVRSPPTNTLPAGGFTAAEVGVHYADPNQGPVAVYVDDVAVGTSRIPCD